MKRTFYLFVWISKNSSGARKVHSFARLCPRICLRWFGTKSIGHQVSREVDTSISYGNKCVYCSLDHIQQLLSAHIIYAMNFIPSINNNEEQKKSFSLEQNQKQKFMHVYTNVSEQSCQVANNTEATMHKTKNDQIPLKFKWSDSVCRH